MILFENAVNSRTFEPDAPNFTSRISGLLTNKNQQAVLAICRRNPETGEAQHNTFTQNLDRNGVGNCIHTYQSDGNPLPAFKGEPYEVPLGQNAESTAQMFWDALDKENRIALVVKSIDTRDGAVDFCIINRLEA